MKPDLPTTRVRHLVSLLASAVLAFGSAPPCGAQGRAGDAVIRPIRARYASVTRQRAHLRCRSLELSGFSAEGGEPVGNSPEEFARWLRAEIAKWTKVVQAANIKPE